MSDDPPVIAPLSSPLRIKRGRLRHKQPTHPVLVRDVSGALVLYGDTLKPYPDAFVGTTLGGTWRIGKGGLLKDPYDASRVAGLLQDWLDNNLPTLVERLVREEIERVARGAG